MLTKFKLTAIVAAMGVVALTVIPARAQTPVAIVEYVDANSGVVELMDYLSPGRVIQLAASDTVVLGYMKSCWHETITGGTVMIGTEQSEVRHGLLRRKKVLCDGGKMQLTSEQAKHSGGLSIRAPSKKAGGWATLPKPHLVVYGLSPMVQMRGGGQLVFERLDRPGEKIELDIAEHQLLRGLFYDLAKASIVLTAGGLYRASSGDLELVFLVDRGAQPGATPIVGRLLPF
jgi:hypothetical protein